MADAFGPYVTEWHGGKTRAYVNAYVESQTDKTATIRVQGCAQANRITQYGVRSSCTGGGSGSGILATPSGTADYAACSGRITVNKSSGGHNVTCSCTVWGDTISGYGPISGSSTASVNVWVGAKVLRPPSAPSGLTAKRNAAASIDLAWKNNATNASSTLIERKKKGEGWVKILDQAKVVDSYTDSPGIGSFAYRVRYWNADGYSGYSNETDYVVTLCAPAAPTLVSPSSGSTIDANLGSVALAWRHNSIDTSAQTQAEVRYTTDGETWSDASATTAGSVEIPLSGNCTVEWQARTRGSHEDWSPWSAVSLFLVRTAPVAILHVETPIRTVPVELSWDYSDAVGTQAAAAVSIIDQSGARVYGASVGTETGITVAPDEFTPRQGATYTVSLTVTSTTSLSHTTQAVFYVDYEPPARPRCAIAVDERDASVRVTAYDGGGSVQTLGMSVFREGVLVGEGLLSGESAVDETPPLDRPVEYRIVAYAPSGSVSSFDAEAVVRSNGYACFNFAGKVLRVGVGLDYSDKTEQDVVLRDTASSELPKAFYGRSKRRSGSLSGSVRWFDDPTGVGENYMLDRAMALKEHVGPVVMRMPYLDTVKVACSVDIAADAEAYNRASVSISWEATS